MAKRITHRIYCWSEPGKSSFTNPEPGRRYYYSVRPVNQPKNSVDHGRYLSASGRNERVLNIKAGYKGKAEIIRNTNPNKKK